MIIENEQYYSKSKLELDDLDEIWKKYSDKTNNFFFEKGEHSAIVQNSLLKNKRINKALYK